MAEFQKVTIAIIQGKGLAAKELFVSNPFFLAKLNGTMCYKSKVLKATLTPTWTKGDSFTLARYDKKKHETILIELWSHSLLHPPKFMGQVVIDPDKWAKTKGEAMWTKLKSRGIISEEVKGELLIQVSFSETPQITYESPLWKKRNKFKGGKSVYAVLYNPSDLVIYRDITCSNELKRFSLKEGKSAVLEAKGNGMTITNAPPDGKITLTGRECFMAEWWRAFSKFTKAPPTQGSANNNNIDCGSGKMYGRNLKDMVSDGIFGSDGVTIPVFLTSLYDIIEKQGLDIKGIFRLSGAKVDIDDGVKAIDGGKVFSEDDDLGIHVVSGLIKIFFRRLPEPLFTFELYSKFIDAANMVDDIVGKLRIMELVKQLPSVNRAILSSLLSLLVKVAANSDVNMMTPSNLSIVFAPAVLWPKVQNALLTLTNLNSAQSVIEVLIVDAIETLAAEEEKKEKEREEEERKEKKREEEEENKRKQSISKANDDVGSNSDNNDNDTDDDSSDDDDDSEDDDSNDSSNDSYDDSSDDDSSDEDDSISSDDDSEDDNEMKEVKESEGATLEEVKDEKKDIPKEKVKEEKKVKFAEDVKEKEEKKEEKPEGRGYCLSVSEKMRRIAKVERRSTMKFHIMNNQQKVRPAITTEDPIKEMETSPKKFEEKARALFEGYDDDSNKYLDTDEFTLFFIDLIKVYSLSYITRDDVVDIMEKISEGDMKITFEQFFSWWTEFNKTLQKD